MNKVVRNIANKAVDLSFERAQEHSIETIEAKEEYKNIVSRCEEIYQILKDNLPEELKHLVDEFDSKKMEQTCIEIRHYFKQGVISGCTDLKCLGELENEIVTL